MTGMSGMKDMEGMTQAVRPAPSGPVDPAAEAAGVGALRALLRRASLLFVLLLALTAGVLLWHQFGMMNIVELNAPSVALRAEDDRSDGGASVATLRRNGGAIEFRCHISARGRWPYCKAIFDLDPSGRGIDLSDYDSMVVEVRTPGKDAVQLGFAVVAAEEGLTRKDRWETYKLNQVDGLDIASGVPFEIPLRWFVVPQWWKDMVKPPLQHSFVNFADAVRLEILTSGGPEGPRVVDIHSVRFVGKKISRSSLLAIIIAAWIGFAVAWLAVANSRLRARLKASNTHIALLAQVNTALELEAQELAGQAYIDPLTGALNRQGLRAELMNTLSLLATPMSAIFADIDHFKTINDRYGHPAGDEVLRQFAAVIAANIRSSDRLVRWGGEEFLIVCPLTDAAQAASLARALRATLHDQTWPMHMGVTASFGIAQHQAGSEINTVIKAADDELYRAKAQGRDQVCVAGA